MLYDFCSTGGSGCTDGSEPFAGLTAYAQGHFYGTTAEGGAFGSGTVFELIADPKTKGWRQKVLCSFCAKGARHASTAAARFPA